MITFNIILGVGTRKLWRIFDKLPGQTVGGVDRRKMPEILLRTVRRDDADPSMVHCRHRQQRGRFR